MSTRHNEERGSVREPGGVWGRDCERARAAPQQDVYVTVLLPCKDEEAAIAQVVTAFRSVIPNAVIYVYDNNSVDRTREVAHAAGALVRSETLSGKGNVVRRMFSDIDADVYVLVDGDDTYDAASSPAMIARLLDEQLDMVSGIREARSESAYRPWHRFGNALLTRMVSVVFGNGFKDVLSGYRVLSRRYVKSFPALSTGFEIETELSVHALALRMPFAEIPTPYKARPAGSASKLRACRDGLRILLTIVRLMRSERPLCFFGIVFGVLFLVSIALAWPLLLTYRLSGVVPRFPTAILTSAIMLLAFLCLFTGLILDSVTHGRREIKRLHYLQISGPRRYARD